VCQQGSIWSEHWKRVRLAEVLSRRVEPIDLQTETLGGLNVIAKITFGGELVLRGQDEKADYKGALFRAHPGDLIYSKIRIAQGSMTFVPDNVDHVAVSNEYPTYTIDAGRAVPGYLELVCRTQAFRGLLLSFASGNTTKMRIRPGEFENLEVPLPPLETQRAIVARWKAAQAEIKLLEQQAVVVEEQSRRAFEAALGLADLPGLGDLAGLRPRVFALWWSESDRWSVEPNRLRKLGFQETPQSHYPSLSISTFGEVIYGLQVCPEREPRDHPTPYLRVANVQRGYLDLTEIKQIEVAPQELAKYRLEPGDVLLCEGNSAELVGRGATWQGEIEGCVHQNHVLRVRLDLQKALPEYVLAYINSSAGQTYFRSKAKRTTNLASINSREVGRMPVPLPPLDVQREIVRRVEESRAEIARLRAQAARRAQEAQVEIEAAILGNEDLPGF